MLMEAVPDFSEFFRVILLLGGIYLIGVLASYFYSRTMVIVSQGILKKFVMKCLPRMQRLPLNTLILTAMGIL